MAGTGGARPGAGRPKGSKDRIWPRGEKRRQAERAREAALQYLKTSGDAVFAGDGVDLMIAVYKNESFPLPLRIQCAAIAAQYERPKLNATDARLSVQSVGKREAEDADVSAWLEAQLDRIAAAEERREAYATEITPPQPPVVVRKRDPATIDHESGIECGYVDNDGVRAVEDIGATSSVRRRQSA